MRLVLKDESEMGDYGDPCCVAGCDLPGETWSNFSGPGWWCDTHAPMRGGPWWKGHRLIKPIAVALRWGRVGFGHRPCLRNWKAGGRKGKREQA